MHPARLFSASQVASCSTRARRNARATCLAPCAASSRHPPTYTVTRAAIAQLVARRSHNPKVVSSILTCRTYSPLVAIYGRGGTEQKQRAGKESEGLAGWRGSERISLVRGFRHDGQDGAATLIAQFAQFAQFNRSLGPCVLFRLSRVCHVGN